MTPKHPTSNGRTRVVVVGAGIVGTCCALWLQRHGFAVTLIDRNDPGSGCSAGNAGILHSGSILPLATPDILRRVPRMLFDPDGPLVIRWRYGLSLLPWFARLVRHATPAEMTRISGVLSELLGAAMKATRDLVDDAGAAHLLKDQGELYVFQSDGTSPDLVEKVSFYRAHGIAVAELNAAELRERVPALSPAYRYGYYLPGSAFTIDPRRLTAALAKHFVARGGVFEQRDVISFNREQTGICVTLSDGSLSCDQLVIAAGAYSNAFAKQAGVNVPLEALRGYHLQLPSENIALSSPLIDGGMNFGAVPMADGIRLAGTVEFAGLNASPNWHRADMLLRLAKIMLPALDGSNAVRWAGDRPGLPDSLPMIGPVPQLPNVWFCFGHGQLGLTTAAASGKALAEAMAGLEPSLDLASFRVDRFSSRQNSGKMPAN